MPITLTMLLESEGLDLGSVRLVRHQARGTERRTPWDLWMRRDGSLETYQCLQSREVFKNAAHLVSFVASPDQRTLFVGVYEIIGKGVAPEGTLCPITDRSLTRHHLYDLAPSQVLREHVGRLVIDWGPGFRSWVQRADRAPKPVTELWPEVIDPPFPGFMEFRMRLSELHGMAPSWREVLGSVRGVYLLSCISTGEQYVGSATGEDGFMGRWNEYAATGHGGNLRMRERDNSDYTATVLEVCSSTASVYDIVQRESLWKEKLGSRDFGLNAN